MNGIMTASRQSNFYGQDLVGTSSSSDHITVPSSNQQNQQNQQPQQSSTSSQLIQQSPQQQATSQNQPFHSQASNQYQQQSQQQHHHQPQHQQQSQQQQQQQQPGTTSQEMPPTYQPFTASYQQTRVPKNFLLENTNYYTVQPGFPLVQTSDYYSGINGSTDYQNSINQIISPSFQMSSVSTPDGQNANNRSKSQVHHPYQLQQLQQPNQLQLLQHQQQQVQELFSTPNTTTSAYIPVKKQKTIITKTDQPQLVTDKYQQHIVSETGVQQQPPLSLQSLQQQSSHNNPAYMLYSQPGISNSAPVSSSSSSTLPGVTTTSTGNQTTGQQFQFTYGSPSQQQASTQMYSLQRQTQQAPPQLQQQQVLSSLPIRNNQIPPTSGGTLVTTPTMPPKSRNSSISRASGETGERQSRATSISSFIPQNEYPERVIRPKVATARWDDENTNCYQVRARNILVSRREDTNYVNGTKLLNVIGMTRGKRDGILKTEKIKNVVKVGSMNLKGVWIPFDRAYEIARNEGVDGLLYPLFVKDIKKYFLTKGHKLKSEDDDPQQLQLQLQRQDIEEDDESTSISSSRNSESKLLETNDVMKSIEDGTTGTGVTSTSSTVNNNQGIVGEVKYVHDYFQRSPQTNVLKDEELYYGSTQNTPLSIPKTL